MVQHARVQDRLALEALAQVTPDDDTAVLLAVVEVEADLRGVELELPALLVRLDIPVIRTPWRGVAVDEPPHAMRDRIEVALDDVLHASEHLVDRERALPQAAEEVVVAASEDAELLVGDNVRRHDKSSILLARPSSKPPWQGPQAHQTDVTIAHFTHFVNSQHHLFG